MKNFSDKIKILLLILLLGAFLRLFGIDWDQGQHLHPDERFLTMVGVDTSFPKDLLDYFNPSKSTLNPYNAGYSFYVYGTFPLYLTKIISLVFNSDTYSKFHLIGRFLSAVFDLGVIFLLYLIGKRLFSKSVGVFASFFYSIMVLPIQLSHFFTVDTYLNFFLILSFYFLSLINLKKGNIFLLSSFLGIVFGFALTSKISAVYFLPIILLGYLGLYKTGSKINKILLSLVFMTVFSYLTARVVQPSLFTDGNFLNFNPNPQFLSNIKQLKTFNDSRSWFPPGVQWKKTTPIIFPLKNLVFWGLGLPLGIFALWSFFHLSYLTVKNKLYKKSCFVLLALIWTIGLFLYLGVQHVKTMRYFLSLYPFLALFSAWKFERIRNKKLKTLIFILAIIYPLSFISIYTKPITRVTASRWIYRNIPIGSTLANEYWDDSLPLPLPNENHGKYSYESLSLYDPENEQKWEKIESQLENTDYIILSSNRLYGSIPKNPEYYPQTTKYYKNLFDGSLGFKKVAEFSSYPCFPPFGKALFCFNDDSSEEAFTVYDHPKVMIFKKK
ncbi:glycosyltransferase family 39 protein [Patescibacteria group bacterium]|nr:glycosyltransferase family 39 protein [Patescibacteria group bacterium]